MTRGILLDIEGTTTPIAFVYDVLFPYARRHMSDYVRGANLSDIRCEYDSEFAAGLNPAGSRSDLLPYIFSLMDQDRKSTALKRIQGEIWLKGFRSGELKGKVFDDVPPAFQRWCENGLDIRIFSSGSILAQRLLFSTTPQGDLTTYIHGYFDTTTGPKNDPASYLAIANVFDFPPSEILFVSDVARELDAARSAGMQTMLCVRPGNAPQAPDTHRVITTFGEISTLL